MSRGFGFVAHGPECRREDLLCERRASRLAAARRASFVFATSRDTGRDLCELTGLAARSIRPLPHTVDPDFIGSDDGCSLAGDESVVEFLTVSRHGSEESLQGLDQALRSFASLAPRHPRARYRIVCERNGTELLRRVATSLGVGHRVIFEQDLDESELAQRYRRSAAFVLPRGFEDSGIRFLEAMGFARACVGCDQDGSAEVIVDGETGFLVRFGDAVRLTSVLERLLASPELCRDLGLAGRQRLIEQFTFEQFRARLEAHLGELLGLH